jgi:dTDP-4-dehydrorhamnose reductase
MRILVTGASGLLGLNLALEASEEHTVFGLVNHQPVKTSAFTVMQADLLAPGTVERILDQTQPEWVIHCAALAVVDACESNPLQARKLNSEVPGELAAYVARGGARLLHVSTDAVFDGQIGGYTEQDHPNPLSIYARTKLDGERQVAAANPQAIVARVNLYGWSLLGRRSLGEFFFQNLRAGKRVQGFTDVFFCPLLANDLARIFLKMLASNLSGLYHVVSSECLSKYEFGVRLARKFGLDESLITATSVEQAGLKAVRSPNLSLSTEKLSQALGEAPPGIDAGIDRFYNLYLQAYPQRLSQMGDGE